MHVFISYDRADSEAARRIRGFITEADVQTWMDDELGLHEEWWAQVLGAIRECQTFVVVLSPDSVASRACRAELDYAVELQRPIVAVMVRPTEIEKAPPSIALGQVVDLTDPTVERGIKLVMELRSLPAPPPLPEPLPPEPAVPASNFDRYRSLVDSESLGYKDQWALLTDLKPHLDVQEDRPKAAALLVSLARRQDVVRQVAQAIDALDLTVATRQGATRGFSQWPGLVDKINDGACTPVLGIGLTDSLIGPRRNLARSWAEKYDFPMAVHQEDDLPEVAQFVVVENGVDTLRSALGKYLRERVVERFPVSVPDDQGEGHLDDMLAQAWRSECSGDPSDVHVALASLPVPVYVNAHPSRLLTEALRAAGRDPVVDLCRWRTDVDWPDSALRSDASFTPSVGRPLVFHLFGTLELPESLVLTEDDYFDFLINVTKDPDLIPSAVTGRLNNSSLMFLGFRLEEWDFRVLLRSLISQEAQVRRKRFPHVAAQLDLTDAVQSPEGAREYLRSYFTESQTHSIDLFWGTADEFVDVLRQKMVSS
jgi:hypothetical protein